MLFPVVPALVSAPLLPQPPRTQTAASLERLVWTPGTRGPLLIVAPDSLTPARARLPREGGVNVLNFAEATQHMLVKTGSLSALVPQTMRVLNLQLGKPETSDLPPSEAIHALAASLDERQWTLLGGRKGLSGADLTPQQQALFTALLPPLRRDTTPVPREAVAQGRLHVQQRTQFFYAYQNEHLNAINGGGFNGTIPSNDTSSALQRDDTSQRDQLHYGFPLALELPNRLKPSQLDYTRSALDKPIKLDGAKTLGELLARTAAATGRDLKADRRLAELPVWLRNTPEQYVRAGDVLEILARSVTGAFRKLEAPGETPLWLLTDDIEGLAIRQRHQATWLDEQEMAGGIRMSKATRQLKALNPLRFIGYDNAYGFSPALVDKILKNGTETPTVLPLSALPLSVSEHLIPRLQEEHTAMREGRSYSTIDGIENPPLDLDHIKLSLQAAAVSLEVPGYGIYHDDSLSFSLSLPLQQAARRIPEPAPVRPAIGQRLAIVFPKTAEEARQAVAASAAAKLNALWIATESDRQEPLQAALDAGREAHLPIAVLVPVTQEPSSAPPDINLLDEPGPYRLPDAPETIAALLPYLKSLAALPGLAGLVLDKSAAPGYEHYFDRSIVGRGRTDEPLDYGYTYLQRLRFVRTEGFDPVDLSYNDGPRFFLSPNNWVRSIRPKPTNPMRRWSDLRFEANKALLKQVFTTLKAAAPTLPLWIRERQSTEDHSPWFGSWDKAEALPVYEDKSPEAKVDPAQQARVFSQRVFFTYSMPAVADAESFLTGLLASETRANSPFPWDGFVLDLQALPIEKALAVLKETKL